MKKGFTLIELMVVIAIIGLFSAVLIPAMKRVKQHKIHSQPSSVVITNTIQTIQ